jgi:hypothetical protein
MMAEVAGSAAARHAIRRRVPYIAGVMGLTAALVATYLGVFLPALGALVCLLVRVSE